MFTELSLGCWSSGRRNLSMYQVSPSTAFFFISYMHLHAPFIMYCLRLFVVVFQEMNCLNMPMFVGSQSFISLPSFMFVSAVVSEIRELKKEKKNYTSSLQRDSKRVASLWTSVVTSIFVDIHTVQ